MDRDQLEQPRMQYKLRSSLKRQSRNPGGNLDVTDEGQDVTLQPQPRRVSFAASRNVKPFLDDPDNNTIWDHTYEEALLSHTDSNNVPSLDSQSNVQETIDNDGRTRTTLGSWPTNCTQYEVVDMNLTTIDKENIHPILEISGKSIKSRNPKPVDTNAALMKTITEPIDMEITLLEHINRTVEVKSGKTKPMGTNTALMKTTIEPIDMEITLLGDLNKSTVEPVDIDESVKSTKYTNRTVCQDVDMSMTCKFNEPFILQALQQQHGNIYSSNGIEEINFVSEHQKEIDMTIPKLAFENNYCPEIDLSVEKRCIGIFQKPTEIKMTKVSSVKVQETYSTLGNAVEFGCVDNTIAKLSETILEPNHGENHTLSKLIPENQRLLGERCISKENNVLCGTYHNVNNMKFSGSEYANPQLDNAKSLENDISQATPFELVKKAEDKRKPFVQISTASSSSMEQSKTKVEQQDKLTDIPITNKSIHGATGMDNLTSGPLHKESTPDSADPLPENKTFQENHISKAVPAVFVDSACNFSLEPEVIAVKKVKDKRIPFGQIYIPADSSMAQSKTQVKQHQDNLDTIIPTKSKSTNEMMRTDNFTSEETHKESTRESVHPLSEIDTLQENLISEATPAIFVDFADDVSLEPETLVVKRAKDKRIPLGQKSIAGDNCMKQNETKEQQTQNKLTKLINEPIKYNNLGLHIPNIHTNMDGELSIIDLHDKDCSNIITPPKVIYSESMPAKPCTSFLDFTTGLSSPHSIGKKKFLNSTVDGTLQLIEATFSKPPRNESGVSEMDYTHALDRSVTVVQYKPVKFVYERGLKLIGESRDLQRKIRQYFEQDFASPKLRKSVLDEKVKRLSICNTPKDQSTDDGELLDDLLLDSSVLETPKSMHEKVTDIFQNNKINILELHLFEENYYVCSTFANLVWFSVKLNAIDGTVQEMNVSAAIEVDYSKSVWPALHDLVARFILNKLQMDNLKSALGTNFDMLSLLDHIIMVTERSFEFFVEFIETRLHLKSLNLSDDGTVSFKIFLTDPPTIWTVAFKMASVETIQQDSLVATSKWDTINQEYLRTILRNTEPGIDCIKRFADAVVQYFRKTINVPENVKRI